jgi:hypothetical protein
MDRLRKIFDFSSGVIASAIPVAVMSLPSFSGLANHKRRNTEGLAGAGTAPNDAEPPLRGAEHR